MNRLAPTDNPSWLSVFPISGIGPGTRSALSLDRNTLVIHSTDHGDSRSGHAQIDKHLAATLVNLATGSIPASFARSHLPGKGNASPSNRPMGPAASNLLGRARSHLARSTNSTTARPAGSTPQGTPPPPLKNRPRRRPRPRRPLGHLRAQARQRPRGPRITDHLDAPEPINLTPPKLRQPKRRGAPIRPGGQTVRTVTLTDSDADPADRPANTLTVPQSCHQLTVLPSEKGHSLTALQFTPR